MNWYQFVKFVGCIVYAARITLCILIPEMNKVLKEDETIKLHDLSVGASMPVTFCNSVCLSNNLLTLAVLGTSLEITSEIVIRVLGPRTG